MFQYWSPWGIVSPLKVPQPSQEMAGEERVDHPQGTSTLGEKKGNGGRGNTGGHGHREEWEQRGLVEVAACVHG